MYLGQDDIKFQSDHSPPSSISSLKRIMPKFSLNRVYKPDLVSCPSCKKENVYILENFFGYGSKNGNILGDFTLHVCLF